MLIVTVVMALVFGFAISDASRSKHVARLSVGDPINLQCGHVISEDIDPKCGGHLMVPVGDSSRDVDGQAWTPWRYFAKDRAETYMCTSWGGEVRCREVDCEDPECTVLNLTAVESEAFTGSI